MTRISTLLGVALTVICSTLAHAREVQGHGLVFESWIADTFFDGHRPGYTDKWDFPGELNAGRGGIPVNPKVVKEGAAIDLGDALRQYDIREPFWLVVGYWKQDGDVKNIVRIVAQRIEPAQWRALWHPIRRENLEELDALIKDRSLDYREVRKLALEMKARPPFCQSRIVVNPKIDARGQRRLQCSLRYRDVVKYLLGGVEPVRSHAPLLWGRPFPNPIESPARVFEKK